MLCRLSEINLTYADDVESGGHKGISGGHTGTHWILTTFVLLGDMFGLGTLTLPADFARLGWAVALPVITVCALGMVYSGILFGRLATHLPASRAFDQLGAAAFGASGKRMVYATVYLTILFEPVIFHLTCMESLQQMLYSANVSQIAAGAIVAVLIFPLGLVQGIEEVSTVAILGTIGMLLAVVTATYKLWFLRAIDLVPTEVVHHGHFNTTLVAIMDLVRSLHHLLLPCCHNAMSASSSRHMRATQLSSFFNTAILEMYHEGLTSASQSSDCCKVDSAVHVPPAHVLEGTNSDRQHAAEPCAASSQLQNYMPVNVFKLGTLPVGLYLWRPGELDALYHWNATQIPVQIRCWCNKCLHDSPLHHHGVSWVLPPRQRF